MSDRQSIHTTSSPDQTPSLTISHPAVVFAPTSVGKPAFQVITIAHAHADTPISLSVSAPEYFTLAVDSHPRFVANLVVTPASLYSYVHIRYVASKRGKHEGQLTIRTADGLQTIVLTGQSSALLLSRRSLRAATIRVRSNHSNQWRAKKKMAGLLLLVAAGLAYLIYATLPWGAGLQSPKATVGSPTEQVARPGAIYSVAQSQLTTQSESNNADRRNKSQVAKKRSKPSGNEQTPKASDNKKRKATQIIPLVADARRPADLTTLPNPVAQETAQKGQNSSSEESDLERELNHRARKTLP
jgi:hypothetical protein